MSISVDLGVAGPGLDQEFVANARLLDLDDVAVPVDLVVGGFSPPE